MAVMDNDDFSLVKIDIKENLTKVNTIGKVFISKLFSYPDKMFLKYKKYGSFRNICYTETFNSMKALYIQFCQMNLSRGERILFLSQNKQQLFTASLCAAVSGFVSVIVSSDYTSSQISEIISQIQPKCIIVSDDEQFGKLNTSIPVISFEKISNEILYYKDIIKKYKNNNIDFEKIIYEIKPDDLAYILYQYNDRGFLEGIKLTHNNILFSVKSVYEEINIISSNDNVLLTIPFDLIGGLFDFYLCLYAGAACIVADNTEINTVLNNLIETNADMLSANTYIWKKFHDFFQIANNPLLEQDFIDSVFKNLKKGLCWGIVQHNSIIEFFETLDIIQFYGFLETSGPYAYKKSDLNIFKSLSEIQILSDNNSEIIVKGQNIFSGYVKNNNFVTEDYFKTGDIGSIDKEGHINIFSNKTKCITTLDGYKILPQRIENLIDSKFISQIVVIGSQKEFLSALIFPDIKYLNEYAYKELKISNIAINELIKNRWIKALYRLILENSNKDLAKFEQINKFALLSDPFTVESMEINSSGEFDREYIEITRSREIEAIYKISFSKLLYSSPKQPYI
jgi:long-chain acyl-CoA synthetase